MAENIVVIHVSSDIPKNVLRFTILVILLRYLNVCCIVNTYSVRLIGTVLIQLNRIISSMKQLSFTLGSKFQTTMTL